jgi:hypothetical protein
LNQQQQIIESILHDEGADLTKSKKEWIKKELDKLVEEKKRNFLPQDTMITNEHIKQLKLSPQQIQKLILQQPSPSKYSSSNHGMLKPLLEADYYKQQ